MSKIIMHILTGLLIFAGCTSFPTTYDRIDSDRVRTLDFSYEPADAAPGDTVTLKAVFAGKKFDIDGIDWYVSYDVISNIYGVDKVTNVQPLHEISVDSGCSFSSNAQCIIKKFVVPENTILNSASIPENWTANIPKEYREYVPPYLRGLSKKDIVTRLEMLAIKADQWSEIRNNNPKDKHDSLLNEDPVYRLYRDTLAPVLPSLLQMFTVPARLFAYVPGSNRVVSEFSVRYNRKLSKLPGDWVLENRNPIIDSIVVYKVKEANLWDFDPESDSYDYESFRLLGPEDEQWDGEPVKIPIDKNYSYFVSCHNQPPDSVFTLESAMQGKKLQEQFATTWFFQLDDEEIENVKNSDYMNIVNMETLISALFPSKDESIKSAVIWLVLSDYMLNENFHPVASAIKEVPVSFTYTKEYLDAKK